MLAFGYTRRRPMIYLDHAASTPPHEAVLRAVDATARELFANPSSAHSEGAKASRALEGARAQVAALLGAEARDCIFTGSGTEADAMGVLGSARRARGRHVVISAIEHPAVMGNAELLEKAGYRLTRVAPNAAGIIEAEDIAQAVTDDTALVAVMLVNNELGTLQPIAAIAQRLGSGKRPHLHVDAVAAAGYLPMSVRTLGCDSIAISGHKLQGPRGVGALWMRPGAGSDALYAGGGQEKGLRSGTENLPAIVGFGLACELGRKGLHEHSIAVAALRDAFEKAVLLRVPGSRTTVPQGTPRGPHIASLAFDGFPAEPLLHALDARGVLAAAGSACASKKKGPSHVLKAIGVGDDTAVLRFSLSHETTTAELEAAVALLAEAVSEISQVVNLSRPRKSRHV
jgi:cysteine desulfurase